MPSSLSDPQPGPPQPRHVLAAGLRGGHLRAAMPPLWGRRGPGPGLSGCRVRVPPARRPPHGEWAPSSGPVPPTWCGVLGKPGGLISRPQGVSPGQAVARSNLQPEAGGSQVVGIRRGWLMETSDCKLGSQGPNSGGRSGLHDHVASSSQGLLNILLQRERALVSPRDCTAPVFLGMITHTHTPPLTPHRFR